MSLQVWLPLNGNLNNQGLSNLTFVINSPTVVNTSGKIGKCYENTSYTSGGIRSNETILLGNNQSMCAWIYMTSVYSSANLMGIGGQHRYSSNQGMGLTIRYVSSTTGYLSVNTGTGSSRTFNTYYGSTLLNAGQWYHVAYTYNGSQVKLYVNGILDGTFNVGVLSNPEDYIGIFCWSLNSTTGNTLHTNYQFNGRINDFRIYDHTLSVKEIEELSKGLILHYKLDSPLNQVPMNLTSWTKESTVTATSDTDGVKINCTQKTSSRWGIYYNITTNVLPNTNYTFSIDCKVTSSSKPFAISVACLSSDASWNFGTNRITMNNASGFTTYTVTVKTESDTSKIRFYLNCACSTTDTANQIAWMKNPKMIIQPSDIIYDHSGYENNGTIIDTLLLDNSSARYKNSAFFNGTTSGILIQNFTLSNIINTAITYSFWIKPDSENGGRSVYFGSYSGTSWSIEKTSGNILRLYWNGSPDESCSGATIIDGSWQHVCITKSGTSNIKVYINGVQKWSSSANHSDLTFPTTYRIGRDTRSNDGTPYKGLMSDFRIYATALTAEQILELYNTSTTIDKNGNVYAREVIE